MRLIDKPFIDCTEMTEQEINEEVKVLRNYCYSLSMEIEAMQDRSVA